MPDFGFVGAAASREPGDESSAQVRFRSPAGQPPASDWDPENPNWTKSHFEALGRGNISFGAGAVLKRWEQTGYDGWISVELGTQRPAMAKGICPSEYMRQSREYLRSLGY